MEQICIFQTIILNRQGWPDFLTTWVKIRNFLSIMLLRLPCYSAYWWVVRFFWSSLEGGVGCLCDVTKPSLLGKLTNRQQAAGEWFHSKVLNILSSFPWSITVETLKNCCRFVFYNNIDSFDIHFLWNFLKSYVHKTERKKFCHHHIISMVCTLIKQRSPSISAQEITQLL